MFFEIYRSFLDGVLSEEVMGLKQDSLMGVTLWSSFFWCFLNIEDYLEFFDTPATSHSNHPNIKKKERKEKTNWEKQ